MGIDTRLLQIPPLQSRSEIFLFSISTGLLLSTYSPIAFLIYISFGVEANWWKENTEIQYCSFFYLSISILHFTNTF